MCLGVPMQVIESGPFSALCERRGKRRQLDMMLVGPQPPGTWVLAFLDHAREVLDPERAAQVDQAILALDLALQGETDLDACFPDLVRPIRVHPLLTEDPMK